MLRYVLLGLVFFAHQAVAEDRFALVIGNGSYNSIPSVKSAIPSSNLVAERLKTIGFEVELLSDANLVDMKRGIALYGQRVRAGSPEDIGVLYYAGHGVNAFDDNFLLPVDVKAGTAEDLDFVAINAGTLLFALNSGSRARNILILDCCVQNPIPDIPDMGTTGMKQRNAPVDNVLIYATPPEGVFEDSDAASQFAVALDLAIAIPDLPVEAALQLVQSSLASDFGAEATPYISAALSESFMFAPRPKPAEEVEVEVAQEQPVPEQVEPEVEIAQETPIAEPEPVEIAEEVVETVPVGAETPVVEAEEPVEEPIVVASEEPVAAPVEVEPIAIEPEVPVETARADNAEASVEDAAWAAAKDSGDSVIILAFMQAYPEGAHVEEAKLAILEILEGEIKTAQAAAAQPEAAPAPAEEIEVAAVEPEVVDESTRSVDSPNSSAVVPIEVLYGVPLTYGDSAIIGKTIEEVTKLSPHFAPVEGLPESYWKEKECAACHKWTQTDLCTQASFYLTEAGAFNVQKKHPLGGSFKQNLKIWAEGGCK